MYKLKCLFISTYNTVSTSPRCLSHFSHLTIHQSDAMTALLMFLHLKSEIRENNCLLKRTFSFAKSVVTPVVTLEVGVELKKAAYLGQVRPASEHLLTLFFSLYGFFML